MNRLGLASLAAFVGWTLACHISTLAHFSLLECALLTPVLVASALFFAWKTLPDGPAYVALSTSPGRSMPALVALGLVILIVVALRYSWGLFWAGSVLLLGTSLWLCKVPLPPASFGPTPHISRPEKFWVGLLGILAACFALTAIRGDLDDAYYVAVAAFTHAHPHAPLLQADPMFDRGGGLPLLFPSYRFSAYEPLGALIAWIFGIPAMDAIYRILPPLAAVATIASTFFCARELNPKRWLVTGSIAIVLLLLLGECHRSFGNFGFVRIFQGKAIFVSALVPLIYGLSFRYMSSKDRPGDLLLLVYAQLAAIGLSNFAILGAPMVGLVAAISIAPPFNRETIKKLLRLAATCTVALPYLAWVALQSHDALVFSAFDQESAQAVWLNIFGQTQQYLIAGTLLLAPLLVRDPVLRWRLAAPCFILLAVLLNPWLAAPISRYITSPPVYWRVTWCLPITIYLATAISVIAEKVHASIRGSERIFAIVTATALLLLTCLAIPYSVTRQENHIEWSFTGRKVDGNDLNVAAQAIHLTGNGQLLASDEISGVVAMYEQHPPLVNVRSFYIDLLKSSMPFAEYQDRKTLAAWVSGISTPPSDPGKALTALDVGTVAANTSLAQYADIAALLMKNGFKPAITTGGYAIWTRPLPISPSVH